MIGATPVTTSAPPTLPSNAERRLVAAVVRTTAQLYAGRRAGAYLLNDPRLDDPGVAHHVLAAAGYHGIVPLLADALYNSSAVPTALNDLTHTEMRTVVARGLRLDAAAGHVTDAFSAAGIAHAYFKGSALAHAYYPSPNLRYGSDVDVLIDPADMDHADEVLQRAGIVALGRGVRGQEAVGISECSYMAGGYGHIDLHWHPMAESPVRHAFRVDPRAMIERARPVTINGSVLPVLDHTDMLITVATHACYSGSFRLGWMVDVAVMAAHAQNDLDVLFARLEETRTALPLQVTLDRASRGLDVEITPVLADGAWRRGVRYTGRWWPVERGHEQLVRGAFVYRATRPTTAASLAGLMRTLPWNAVTRYRRRKRNVIAT